MEALTVMSALQHMLLVTMLTVCLVTLPTLIVGVVISVIQAATQINEMTITFIPKLIVMFLVVLTLAPWLFAKLAVMMQDYMLNIPSYIR